MPVDSHCLISGATGAGKSSVLRWLAASHLSAGWQVAFLDCKQSGAYSAFSGREGVLGVADEPDEWAELAGMVADQMTGGYKALKTWRQGKAEVPAIQKTAILCDEVVDGIDTTPKLADPIEKIIRLGREAGFRAIVSLLRPDVAEGLSGLARRSLTARMYLGKLEDPTEAAMMFGPLRGKQAREMAAEMDFPPGRGIGMFGNRLYRLQLPRFPEPGNPEVERLLPTRRQELTEFEKLITARQSVMDKIRELRSQGLDFKQIAARLNADGYRQRDGKPWDQAAVRTDG